LGAWSTDGRRAWEEGDLNLLSEIWNKLNPDQRALFLLPAEHPGAERQGRELGPLMTPPTTPAGVRDLLRYPGTLCKQVGMVQMWEYNSAKARPSME
jgi:hypothetical protein